MSDKIFLNKDLAENMMLLAQEMRQKPECGLLFGKKEEKSLRISELIPIQNIAREWHQHVNVNKQERKELIEKIESQGLDYIADFHTHKKICKVTTIDKFAIDNIYGKALWLISTPTAVKAFRVSKKNEENTDYPEVPIFFTSKREEE